MDYDRRKQGHIKDGLTFNFDISTKVGWITAVYFSRCIDPPDEGEDVVDISYDSDKSILMWMEDKTLLWYSEYDKIYISDASFMFSGLYNLEVVDMNGILDDYAKPDYSFMFSSCNSLKYINLAGLTLENAKDVSYMFYKCYRLKKLDLSNCRLVATEYSHMASQCPCLHWIYPKEIRTEDTMVKELNYLEHKYNISTEEFLKDYSKMDSEYCFKSIPENDVYMWVSYSSFLHRCNNSNREEDK